MVEVGVGFGGLRRWRAGSEEREKNNAGVLESVGVCRL